MITFGDSDTSGTMGTALTKVHVTGGTFTYSSGAAVHKAANSNTPTKILAGGSYSNNVIEFCADGYSAVRQNSGYYTVGKKVDPNLPIGEPAVDAEGKTTITTNDGSGAPITVDTTTKTATITDSTSATKMTIQYSSMDTGASGTSITGVIKSAKVECPEIEAAPPVQGVAASKFSMNIILAGVETTLPSITSILLRRRA